MREYVGEGATIEEAIEKGLQELAASREQVEIEVLENPKKRLFGLSSKNAVVRLRLKTPEEETPPKPQAGLVWVTDGQVGYAPPEPGGEVPRCFIDSQLKVEYNGKPVSRHVALDNGIDSLQIILPEDIEPTLHYSVQVDPTKTIAELLWKKEPGSKYTLNDQAPSHTVTLSVSKEVLEPPSLTLEHVREIIEIEGLVHGVDLSSLTPELLQRSSGLVTIARGTLPIPPQQPQIHYVFKEDKPDVDLESLRIDYYEVHGISSVKVGTPLAVKTPGKPGVPGKNVYGGVIPAEPLKEMEIKVGEGAVLSEDGLTASASIGGLPVLSNGVVQVLPIFELNGDADISTGNITMDGAIIIHGNVQENVKVESSNGTILVDGLVSGAQLRASGSISVGKNVLRSQLHAGGQTVVQLKTASMIHNIGNQLDQLIKAYDAVVAQTADIPVENLVKHLLELKFYSLPKDIKAFAEYFSTISIPHHHGLHELVAGLTINLLGQGPLQIKDVQILKDLYSLLRTQEMILDSKTKTDSNIVVGYLQNSHLEASGAVTVTGQGSYYSSIVAGQGFFMERGVFRGGDITVANGDIAVKELGGPTGVLTEVFIVKEGRITANRVHPNVTVSIGEQRYKFGEEASRVKAFLSDGLLTVYAGSVKLHG